MTKLYGDAARAEMRRYSDARLRKWRYGNAWNNTTGLDSKDEADCSDWTDALYTHLGYPLRGMSYQQAEQGEEIYTWSGQRGGANAAFNKVLPQLVGGELVCMGIDRRRPGQITHTEAHYADAMSYGHGGPGPGPTFHNIGRWDLLAAADVFTIRRIIEEHPPKPDTDIVEEIKMATKATHVVFKAGGGICIANLLAGTYQRMPNMKVFELRKTVLSRTADLRYWSEFTTKKDSDEADPRAFGIEMK